MPVLPSPPLYASLISHPPLLQNPFIMPTPQKPALRHSLPPLSHPPSSSPPAPSPPPPSPSFPSPSASKTSPSIFGSQTHSLSTPSARQHAKPHRVDYPGS